MDAGQFIIASALTAIAVLLMTTLHPKASWTYHLLLLWDTSAVSFALLALGLTLLRSNADIPPVTSHNLLFSAVLMGLMDIGHAVLFFALKLLKSRGLSDIAAVEEALIKPGVSGNPRLVFTLTLAVLGYVVLLFAMAVLLRGGVWLLAVIGATVMLGVAGTVAVFSGGGKGQS